MERRHFVLLTLVGLLGALVALPATALGAKPEIIHEHVATVEEDVDVCGVVVDIVTTGQITTKEWIDEAGELVRFQQTFSIKATLTAANGSSVIIQNSAQARESGPPLIDEEAGTITFVTSFRGLAERIKTPHGPVLVRDAGFATIATIFDLETGDFISTEILVIHGPHPDAESDFALFCEVITDALT
jgi:hypothetical protein